MRNLGWVRHLGVDRPLGKPSTSLKSTGACPTTLFLRTMMPSLGSWIMKRRRTRRSQHGRDGRPFRVLHLHLRQQLLHLFQPFFRRLPESQCFPMYHRHFLLQDLPHRLSSRYRQRSVAQTPVRSLAPPIYERPLDLRQVTAMYRSANSRLLRPFTKHENDGGSGRRAGLPPPTQGCTR